MRICPDCLIPQSLENFNKANNRKDKLQVKCKKCQKIAFKDWYTKNKEHKNYKNKAWRESHPDRFKELGQKWREDNKEYVLARGKDYREANKEKESARARAWYKENKKRVSALQKIWNANNKDKRNAGWMKRHALKLKAIPSWADYEKIKEIYKEAKTLENQDGIVRNIDHIIPLQGKYICGFHIAENLQILPASENFKKYNNFTPYVESEGNPNQF